VLYHVYVDFYAEKFRLVLKIKFMAP
jgi:hypothetical protein